MPEHRQAVVVASADSVPLDIFGDKSLAGTPDLPGDALPKVIEDFACDEAERLGVAPGIMAAACLAVTAGSIDDGFVVQPKVHDTRWVESARLWVGLVDEVGEKKTPAMRAALAPLAAVEKEWNKENKAALIEYEREKRLYDRNEDDDEPPERPRLRRRLVGDITIEAVSDVLVDNPAGILCFADELTGWFGSFDAYRTTGAGKDRAHWLELYNGGPKYIDRVRRGAIYVPNWSASVLGGIQPGPMQRIAGKITDDGLVQRFMVVFGSGATDGVDREPNYEAVNLYEDVIGRLVKMAPGSEGTVFTLSGEAQEERARVMRVTHMVKELLDTSRAFRGHLAKWDGLFGRLLLTFHLTEMAARGLDEPRTTMGGRLAAKLARFMLDFLLPNAARFYTEILGSDHLVHARWIAGHILAHHLEKITIRDIYRAYHALKRDPSAIQQGMTTLHLAGWVTPLDPTSGRPATQWRIDPRVHGIFAVRAEIERRQREETRQRIYAAAKALGLSVGR